MGQGLGWPGELGPHQWGTVEPTEQHVERQTPGLPAPPSRLGSRTLCNGTGAPDPRRMCRPSGQTGHSNAGFWKKMELKKGLCRWLKAGPGNHLLYPPQMVIAASQIQWTADVTKCLMTAKERSDKKILKVMKKKQVGSSSSVGQTWSWNWGVGRD